MKMIITAGGTGGHIMPALAIALAVKKRLPGTQILFIGTDRGMEQRLAHRAGIDFFPIKALGMKGKSLRHIMKAFGINLRAFFTALHAVRSFRPTWVIGTGGYVTGMVVLAGFVLRHQVAIQEQNSVPGLTNRLLSHLVHRVFLAFPDSEGFFPRNKTMIVGNPVRAEIAPPVHPGTKILIIGGSLGAHSINTACIQAMKILKDQGIVLEVTHQTGKADFTLVKQAYEDMAIPVDVYDFIDDMAAVYQSSCLAVCRSGGLTLSELSKTAVPAIMIPYPHATDNHQMKNALYVQSRGGGWIIPDESLSPQRLALEIRTRMFDLPGLSKASSRMASLGLGDGADMIAKEITGV